VRIIYSILRKDANYNSNLLDRLHNVDLRYRNGPEGIQERQICTSWQMEHDHLRGRGSIPSSAHMDANNRVADVQSMLWWFSLDPWSIRPAILDCHLCHGLWSFVAGCSHQYSTNEDTGTRSERAHLSIANDLLLADDSIDLRMCCKTGIS
jgi:hypothetical protein